MKKFLLIPLFFVLTPIAFAQSATPSWLPADTSGYTQAQQNQLQQTSQFQIQQRNGNLSYTPLEPFYAYEQADINSNNFGSLINNIIRVLIALGALIAVVTMVIGGVMYMTTEVTHTKDEAKKRILSSVYGLVLLGASVLILNTINPQLTRINLQPGTIAGTQNPTNTSAPTQLSVTSPRGINIYNGPDAYSTLIQLHQSGQCPSPYALISTGTGIDSSGEYTTYECR